METYIKTFALNLILLFGIQTFAQNNLSYPIVDTDQQTSYNNLTEIPQPNAGEVFYGQDAQYDGFQPSYQDNGDGTVTDLVTGLMWQKSPDMDGDGDIDYEDKMSYSEAMAEAENFNLAGYTDWRLPSIKEMYSLIVFSGIDPSGYEGSTEGLTPFIDTAFFDFAYGDETAGERIIDAQMASSNLYVGTTMNGDETMFGVNFADGRIKGYPTGPMPGQTEDKQFYVMYVRGNADYGINDFVDNENGTITDEATGLMWMQEDSQEGMNWEAALSYAENYEFAGYSDWRLPNVKELQSILDYTRCPQITNSPALDPLFNCSEIINEEGNTDYPFYWSGTTHVNMQNNANGGFASYVCFGTAYGFMEQPPGSSNYVLLDVHGAGAQRSDPKVGNPDDYPYGHGPQGDVVRIYNYVRLVRDINSTTGLNENSLDKPKIEIYPNPINSILKVYLEDKPSGTLEILNTNGQIVFSQEISTETEVFLNVSDLPSGMFFIQMKNNHEIQTSKFIKN